MSTLYAQSGNNAISVIDTDTDQVTATIPIGGFVLRFNPDASRLYAISAGPFGVFSQIDTASNTILGVIPFGNDLRDFVLHPYGTRAYIIDRDANLILVVNTLTLALLAMISLPSPDANKLFISPDGTRILVLGEESRFMDVVDTRTNAVTTTIIFSFNVSSLAYSTDAARIFVTQAGSTVNVLDALTLYTLTTIYIAAASFSIEIRSNFAYVGSASTISVIDHIDKVATLAPAGPKFILSPDGTRLYAALSPQDDGISAFNITTNHLIDTNPAYPEEIADLAITPDGSRIYSSANGSNRIHIVDPVSLTDIGQIDMDGNGGSLALKPNLEEPDFEKIRSTGVLTNNVPSSMMIEFLNNDPSAVARIQYYGFIIVDNGIKTPFIGEVLTLEPFVAIRRFFQVPAIFEIQIGVQYAADVLSTLTYSNASTSTVILDSQLSPLSNLTIVN